MQLSEEDVHLLNLYKGIFDAKCRGDKLKLDNIILDKLLYAVIYELIQLYARNVSPHSNTLTYMKGHLYGQEFLSLLAEDKCHHRKVEYYADKLCITPRYLSTVCQKETGKTPSEWIREKNSWAHSSLFAQYNFICKRNMFCFRFSQLFFSM